VKIEDVDANQLYRQNLG